MYKKIFLLILFFSGLANFCLARTFENYLDHDEIVGSIYDSWVYGQVFQATDTTFHSSIGVKVWLRTATTRYNDIDVALCVADSKLPYPECFKDREFNPEVVFATGTIYASSINSGVEGNEYHIIFDNITRFNLESNQHYALLLKSNYATSGTLILLKGGRNDYESGKLVWYDPEQELWFFDEEYDLYFQIMGEYPTTSDECPPSATNDMCVCTTTLNYISNTTTGAGFWLDSSISFGDFLIATFLLGILIIFLVQFIFSLEIPKKVNLKKL